MRIGIDFDNTIVCYDQVFYLAAKEINLVPPSINPSKTEIRDYLRSIGQEEEWTKLQGYVYGARMDLASAYPNVDHFFQKALKKHLEIYIISHKTLYPYKGPRYNLHEAAQTWLLKQNFFNKNIHYFFELTLEEKLKKIEEMQCDYFIDDLPELLAEKNFPKNTKAILFDPNNLYPPNQNYQKFALWDEILNYFSL
ncbi:MAG: haloacid dehalogenase-like hydrolase [Chlamydiae bacterium]|nr:haloacid dehalogenase-like hydrolase [Chlamydiota bacterium]